MARRGLGSPRSGMGLATVALPSRCSNGGTCQSIAIKWIIMYSMKKLQTRVRRCRGVEKDELTLLSHIAAMSCLRRIGQQNSGGAYDAGA